MTTLGDLWNSFLLEPVDEASGLTLRMQLDNLRARFDLIDEVALSEKQRSTYDDVNSALARAPALSWDDAFRIETQIGSLLQGANLRQELSNRLRWAENDHVPQSATLQMAFGELIKADSPATDDALRHFYLDVMEAIHWHSKRKFIMRRLRVQATRRTLLLGTLALAAALLAVVFGIAPEASGGLRNASLPSSDSAPGSANVFGAVLGPASFALYTCVIFGFLGALFSRLITLQTYWSAMALDELYNARSYSYILLRATIGIVGALVVYVFLQSGLVEGSVFPKFSELGVDVLRSPASTQRWPSTLLLPSKSLALMIMWSFIAGFSESLVPTVLASTERQFGGALNGRP